MQKSDF